MIKQKLSSLVLSPFFFAGNSLSADFAFRKEKYINKLIIIAIPENALKYLEVSLKISLDSLKFPFFWDGYFFHSFSLWIEIIVN